MASLSRSPGIRGKPTFREGPRFLFSPSPDLGFDGLHSILLDQDLSVLFHGRRHFNHSFTKTNNLLTSLLQLFSEVSWVLSP